MIWMVLSGCNKALGEGVQTLRFHHHPSNVPCMIHVSAPMSDIDARYDCMRRDRFAFCSS